MSQRTINLLILVAAVVMVAIYVAWPGSPGIHVAGFNKDFETRLGLDLQGGVQALLEADLPAGTAIDQEAMGAAVGVVESRVNGLGLNEAVVQQAGNNRIVVELPGEQDPEKALSTIRQTGLLEFVDMSGYPEETLAQLGDKYINTNLGAAPAEVLTYTANATTTFKTIMTGAELQTVRVETNPQNGQYEIAFTLNDKGAKIFRDFTAAHVQDILAIVIDKQVISMPRINQAIPDGQGVITGNYTYETANSMAIQLRYGSLPIPLKVIEVRTVGPTLGQDSLLRSSRAYLVGFTIVILFMLLYYRVAGLSADISILIYALVAFAVFRFIPITLTLPGIAGLMLSTGSALDANILIFERMKEELRAGKTLRQAVDLGWRRAWPSIRDSNIATLITSGILFWFSSTYGATVVKGFSITLFIGVLISVFTALVVTRLFIEIVLATLKSKDYAKWFGI